MSTRFEKVRQIFAEHSGVDPNRITMETDIASDLGLAGDDGDELISALDEAFEIEWHDLNVGVHFGNETVFPLLPWDLEGNCELYEPQPFKVSDVVKAADTGRWPGTKVILRPKRERDRLYFCSYLFLTILVGTPIILFYAVLAKILGW